MQTGSSHNRIADLGGGVPPLWAYVFTTSTGSATLKGFFVDIQGLQIGATVSGTIDATPRTLVGANASCIFQNLAVLPAGAVGFRGRLSAACVYSTLGKVDGTLDAGSSDMDSNPTNYPALEASDDFSIGRVG